ncbi:SPL family radical SAM protein [Methanimicrococcus hacksteinii]|uniref:SPL family radical SAM protein n=1 Tax=Methanimicrococcus hacksteinii TaxID=3028293 RepID=UPI00298F11FA|nr:radical SAM protein [Methanimicrococcus sp. At1]
MKHEIDLFGSTHMMNIYRGCDHGCIYCDSRSECYQGGRPQGDFGIVHAKENALFLIEQELQSRRKANAPEIVIGTGSMSDPYNSFEKELELTRGALKLFDKYKCGVGVITKSALIKRDADLYSAISTHSPVNTGITITTTDDEIARQIEPNVSAPAERFGAVKTLTDAGVFCGVHMNPILPFITDNEENIRSIVEQAAENNADYVLCYGFGMTLRKGNREFYYENLDKERPGLKEKYMKTYGTRYNCACENAEPLAAVFREECKKHGLLYRIKEINQAWKKEKTKQKKLFEFGNF